MKFLNTLCLVMFIAVATSMLFVAPALAQYYDAYGLIISVYPQQPLVFWTTSDVTTGVIVFIRPPWYYGVGNGSSSFTFQTVTLTATLTPTGLVSEPANSGAPPTVPMTLLGGMNVGNGSTVTIQWTNINMGEDSYGAVNGGYVTGTITFLIGPNTATGFYILTFSGQATGNDVTFAGWNQVGVSLRPPGYGPLFGNNGGAE